AAGGDLRRQAAEPGAPGVDAAAHHHEVLRDHLVAELAHAALEAEAGDVVLAASVRAAADLDVEAGGGGDEIGPFAERVAEEPAQAAGLGDGEPAGLGPRTARAVGERARVGPA